MYLLLDAEKEIAIADAIGRIGWHSPFYEREQSLLVRILNSTRSLLLIDFEEQVDRQQAGQHCLELWKEWCGDCQCAPGSPRRECSLHTVMHECRIYVTQVDEGWYEVAGWYRTLPTHLHGDDLALMYRKVERWREESQEYVQGVRDYLRTHHDRD